ncbi:MAG TPA: S8 family serine peptidase [Bdellovibrionota bacterium]|jgi:thermitase|nr:S8 family serine peptidase [Bdellovibrionota bacterium]
MKRGLKIGVALVLGACLNQQINFIPNAGAKEFVAKVKPGVAFTLDQNSGMSVLDVHAEGSLILVDIDERHEGVLLTRLFNTDGVDYVVPNFKLHRLAEPVSAAALREQWAISKVNALKAWTLAGHRGKKEIVVAVIDTGVDYNHESLKTNMVPGFDYAENDADPMDKTSFQNPGHGTHCAGIIGANGAIENGTIGIAPGVSIMPIRFLDERGSGDLMNGIKAMDFAIQNNVRVISASWGAAVPESQARPLIEAVQRVSDANIVFVAAAANDGKNNDKVSMYPANARFANTISVAASNSSDGKPNWSNYGRANVDIAAPGDAILSTLPGHKYGELSGTSMATPLVSGSVALLLSQDPTLTGAQLRSILQATGSKVSIETACNCRIDVGAAMETVVAKKMTVVPAAATIKPAGTLQFGAIFGEGALRFESSNPAVAEISATGMLTAKSVGEVTVTVTDAKGTAARSLPVFVAEASSTNPDPGEPGNPGGGECPFPDENTCKVACEILPSLPWCSGGNQIMDLNETIQAWSEL